MVETQAITAATFPSKKQLASELISLILAGRVLLRQSGAREKNHSDRKIAAESASIAHMPAYINM
jgi:hypothetical protein